MNSNSKHGTAAPTAAAPPPAQENAAAQPTAYMHAQLAIKFAEMKAVLEAADLEAAKMKAELKAMEIYSNTSSTTSIDEGSIVNEGQDVIDLTIDSPRTDAKKEPSPTSLQPRALASLLNTTVSNRTESPNDSPRTDAKKKPSSATNSNQYRACRYCDIEFHKVHTPPTESNRTESPNDPPPTDAKKTPCQHCDKLCRSRGLHIHEKSCKRRVTEDGLKPRGRNKTVRLGNGTYKRPKVDP
ncbi:hypothetical protein FRACYDRAFT_241296 [Fragilariopsis cylindrus CCMP1102]|uniref:Uncharacterized protein n=1 Tax=Fragilariopsis cylindrus CCMP1102 TaxID=635003 RepID=A0A1E7F9C7_9STRA|nr:hypothetical protein FRACYDRAFT_241296 [Fragilariopsis cylindrus CCMP1102]|eukprot:OEU14739.1 hypothetical protein FRACYDRAFT_241296 [Fragilariopsis cylindrus CCMP1102]